MSGLRFRGFVGQGFEIVGFLVVFAVVVRFYAVLILLYFCEFGRKV